MWIEIDPYFGKTRSFHHHADLFGVDSCSPSSQGTDFDGGELVEIGSVGACLEEIHFDGGEFVVFGSVGACLEEIYFSVCLVEIYFF